MASMILGLPLHHRHRRDDEGLYVVDLTVDGGSFMAQQFEMDLSFGPEWLLINPTTSADSSGRTVEVEIVIVPPVQQHLFLMPSGDTSGALADVSVRDADNLSDRTVPPPNPTIVDLDVSSAIEDSLPHFSQHDEGTSLNGGLITFIPLQTDDIVLIGDPSGSRQDQLESLPSLEDVLFRKDAEALDELSPSYLPHSSGILNEDAMESRQHPQDLKGLAPTSPTESIVNPLQYLDRSVQENHPDDAGQYQFVYKRRLTSGLESIVPSGMWWKKQPTRPVILYAFSYGIGSRPTGIHNQVV